MLLTTRQHELLCILLQTNGFLTMAELAARLGVSARTVQRELDAAVSWLNQDSNLIQKKSGWGVRFCGDAGQLDRLRARLNDDTEQVFSIYAPGERCMAILLDLLTKDEPQKISTYTRMLGVTGATVGNDLDRCEVWLAQNDVQLVRKPGVGIYVEADESRRRRAIVQLYYQNHSSGEQGETWGENFFDKLPHLSHNKRLFQREQMDAIRRMLEDIPALNSMVQSDRGRNSLMIHLYLILMRTWQEAGIEEMEDDLPSGDSAVVLADALIDGLRDRFNVQVAQGERGYLTSVLHSAQGLHGFCDQDVQEQAQRIASRMIMKAELCTGVLIDPNGGFLDALIKHLVPTITRLNKGLDIRNPLLSDIQDNYEPLYELAKECATVLSEEIKTPVPAAEIGYLAVHLGVALEDSRSFYSRRIRAVISCPTGMVTAQLLALRINREFSDIETVDILPTVNLDYTRLMENHIDMIISTVGLQDAPLPSIQVSPFLCDKDKDAVWQLLKACRNRCVRHTPNTRLTDLAASLKKTQSAIQAILQVLENLFVWVDAPLNNMDDVIRCVSEHVASNDANRSLIAHDIQQREQLGSTILADMQLMLLHCRSDGVDQVFFGVIRHPGLEHPYENACVQIKTILVMLAPQQISKQAMSVMGSISRGVVEDGRLMEAFQKGSVQECYNALEKTLDSYYYSILH